MDPSEDLHASLDKLKQKIEHAASERKEEHPSSEGSKLGKAMHVATEFLAAVGVGGVMGYFLDRAFDTSPLLLIAFFFIGFAAGVRNLLRVRDF